MSTAIKLIRRTPQTSKKTVSKRNGDFYNVPATVDDIIQYWNSKPGLAKLRMPVKDPTSGYLDPSKRFKACVLAVKRLIAGTAFANNEFVRKNRKFSYNEIKMVIDRFSLAASSDRHHPLRKDSLKKFSLVDFVYSDFYKDEMFRSQFIFYLENEPRARVEIAGEAPAEKFPALTHVLLKKLNTAFNFDPDNWRTRNNVIVASNNLYGFWVFYEKEQQWAGPMSVNSIANELVESLIIWSERKEDRVVLPQTLVQDWVYKDIFKTHCMRLGLLMIGDRLEDELPDEALILPPEEEAASEYREEAKAQTANISSIVTEAIFDEPENEYDPIWEEIKAMKKIMAEKERNRYENAPYD